MASFALRLIETILTWAREVALLVVVRSSTFANHSGKRPHSSSRNTFDTAQAVRRTGGERTNTGGSCKTPERMYGVRRSRYPWR
jgi:hypothetical protein